MLKTLTLMIVIFNPATDTERTVSYGTYEYTQCFEIESYINSNESPFHLELIKNNLELVETYCD